jgi:putative radical SAM enzyme (TIGR03279 family)
MPAGLISAVAPDSLAKRAGLRAGDELIAINEQPLRDVIDVRFYAAEEALSLRFRRAGRIFEREIARRYGEPLGLEFTEPTFDGVRRCENRCEFCFVAQMPPGLRPSLYVRDDDYRYSFLFGNYITLTNLTEADWARIAAQDLSPLYVSVQATESALRRRMLGNPQAPDVVSQLERLADLGVTVHTQLVLTPGVNDGPHLERSLTDLAALYPAVRSVSVVPVGLTRYHRGGCRPHTRAEARVTFDRVRAWQACRRPQLGATFAYLSDEWYLRLDEPVPPLAHYDGLDLTENGVGLVRRFLESGVGPLHDLLALLAAPLVVTGTLFAPVLRALAPPEVRVVPVTNRFLGPTVTVAGLLAGADVVSALERRGPTVVLPPAMFGGPEGRTLDGMSVADVEAALDRPVVVPADEEGAYGA